MAVTSEWDGRGPTRPMDRSRRRWGRLAGVAIGLVVVVLAAMAPVGPAATVAGAAGGPSDGIVCTTNSDGRGQSNFLLTATDGYISMPDGNSVYMWSYGYDNGPFQHPGPVLCVTEGETVNITLVNHLRVPTSIELPGQVDVQADGAAAAPEFDSSGMLVALAKQAAPGGSVSYAFTASEPGTFVYRSGSDPQLQVQMGLFGTIVVRPVQDPGGPAFAYDTVTPAVPASDANVDPVAATRTPEQGSAYDPGHEYVLMLSEVDPDLHLAVEQGDVSTSSDRTQPYLAHYFLINGRAFPDTIAPNHAGWLPNQPYGALARVQPAGAGSGLPALLRYAAFGPLSYPFHPHSNHERIIGIDGSYLHDGASDLSSEKFAVVVNPGQTQDALFSWTNVEDYTSSSDLSVAPPNGLNLTEGDYWSGSPFLGQSSTLNPGINPKSSECGEYYHVAHSHNLSQATNYGASFGGMLTLIRVDPAGGCG